MMGDAEAKSEIGEPRSERQVQDVGHEKARIIAIP